MTRDEFYKNLSLAHSAKGTTWSKSNTKYKQRIKTGNGWKYIYDDETNGTIYGGSDKSTPNLNAASKNSQVGVFQRYVKKAENEGYTVSNTSNGGRAMSTDNTQSLLQEQKRQANSQQNLANKSSGRTDVTGNGTKGFKDATASSTQKVNAAENKAKNSASSGKDSSGYTEQESRSIGKKYSNYETTTSPEQRQKDAENLSKMGQTIDSKGLRANSSSLNDAASKVENTANRYSSVSTNNNGKYYDTTHAYKDRTNSIADDYKRQANSELASKYRKENRSDVTVGNKSGSTSKTSTKTSTASKSSSKDDDESVLDKAKDTASKAGNAVKDTASKAADSAKSAASKGKDFVTGLFNKKKTTTKKR